MDILEHCCLLCAGDPRRKHQTSSNRVALPGPHSYPCSKLPDEDKSWQCGQVVSPNELGFARLMKLTSGAGFVGPDAKHAKPLYTVASGERLQVIQSDEAEK